MSKKNRLYITTSELLNQVWSSPKFTAMTTLDKIDYLNRYRRHRNFYRYGLSSYQDMDNIITAVIGDQPNRTLTFEHRIYLGGKLCKPISFRFHSNDVGYLIRYPVNAHGYSAKDLNDYNQSIIPLDPQGEQTAERVVREFIRSGVTSSKGYWALNEEYNNLFKLLRKQYEDAWLDLKRRQVSELKATLDRDSVSEFIAAKSAEKTQAIMDIAMAVGALNAKLETYRKRIGDVSTTYEAEKMFNEVDTAFRALMYTQERNKRRLNTKARIPGGKRVKAMAVKKEE